MGVVGAAGILVLLAAQAAGDPFTAQRAVAAALNPRSPRFTIAVADTRRTFRIGERIPLVFSYDDLGVTRGRRPEETFVRWADAVVDGPAATLLPFRDFERTDIAVQGGVCCGCCGASAGTVSVAAGPRFGGIGFDERGVPFFRPDLPPLPPPPPPKPPPLKVTYLLNEGLRFDAPGRYRVYMADHGGPVRADRTKGREPPLISNIVEFDITADDAWLEETVRAAVAVLETASDPEQRAEAARTLRFAGSRGAIDVMARRVSAATAANYLENRELERGLFGARDRRYAIAAMARRIDDPRGRIGFTELRVTAALQLTHDTVGPLDTSDKRRAILAVDQRRLRMLARLGRLRPALDAKFRRAASRPAVRPDVSVIAVTPALAAFAPLVETALTGLSAREREAALVAHGITLADDDRFTPMLKRFAARGSRIARVLLHDFTLPPALPIDITADQPSQYLVAGFDLATQRRQYYVWGVRVPFTGLSQVFSQLPPGTALIWADHGDQPLSSWLLDRNREFQRVESIARRHGVLLERR